MWIRRIKTIRFQLLISKWFTGSEAPGLIGDPECKLRIRLRHTWQLLLHPFCSCSNNGAPAVPCEFISHFCPCFCVVGASVGVLPPPGAGERGGFLIWRHSFVQWKLHRPVVVVDFIESLLVYLPLVTGQVGRETDTEGTYLSYSNGNGNFCHFHPFLPFS